MTRQLDRGFARAVGKARNEAIRGVPVPPAQPGLETVERAQALSTRRSARTSAFPTTRGTEGLG